MGASSSTNMRCQSKEAVAEEFVMDRRFVLDGQKKYGKIGVTYLKFHDRED